MSQVECPATKAERLCFASALLSGTRPKPNPGDSDPNPGSATQIIPAPANLVRGNAFFNEIGLLLVECWVTLALLQAIEDC
jgi:hypothetical protein